MFEVPDAKRIKRSELFHGDSSPQSSRSVSPTAASDHEDEPNPSKIDYGFEYDFISPDQKPAQPSQANITHEPSNDDNADEQEFDFRLFTTAATQPSQAIRLSATPPPADPTEVPSLDEANFLRPNRPDNYYFTSALPPNSIGALKSQYATVALSTTDVLSLATLTNWPGTAIPWRCIHVKLTKPTKLSQGHDRKTVTKQLHSTTDSRRGRPSKKRRILFRKRLALRANLAAQAEHDEEAEREKRTRRNREKKVKRKEREKRKKLESEDQPESIGTETRAQGRLDKDEDHSMIDKNVESQGAGTPSAAATINATTTAEQLRPPSAMKGAQPNKGSLLKASIADSAPEAVTHSTPPTARRAAPTSRAPTSRAPTSRAPTARATGS
ncbi:hypothetical protein EDD36DRAFT_467783 [Exophiala viscosa]|uniref:Uncharacterized protein n=1 Tax=Exophiala viscosa TaxID=2486360 RepID=A0AAN6DNL6_9EURO|nr:hypothetical protein EDD36DRAFT_467783 [Exophiala viscosa]